MGPAATGASPPNWSQRALGLVGDRPGPARPEDRRRRARRDARGVRDVRAVPRRPQGDDLRLGPHPAPTIRSTTRRRDIAAALADRGWMVVTGAGPGIMQAAMEGAGRERSIGVSIRLPFEQGANPVIAGDEKYVSMKYFFTRKLMLVKEARAFVCLPGGFGTLDETFELLTLTQTGKGLPVPIVLARRAGRPVLGARSTSSIRDQLVSRGLVVAGRHRPVPRHRPTRRGVPRDRALLRQLRLDPLRRRPARHPPAPRPDRRAAGRAQRAVRPPRASAAAIERTGPLADRACATDDHVDLPRIRFAFRQAQYGDLRALIDALNGFVALDDRSAGAALAQAARGRRAVQLELTSRPAAFSTARRACVRALSAAGRCVAPSATASLEHVEATARRARRRSPRAASASSLVAAHASPPAPRRRGRSGGATVDAGGGEVHRAARVGADATTVAPVRRAARSIAASLRSRIVGRQLRLQRRVGAAGAAAQPVVVELDDVGDAGEHASAPAGGPAARGAGGTGPARSPGRARRAGAGSRSTRSASHSWTSTHPRRERRRLGGAEQVAVVLHRRAAAGRVDEDRRVARHRRASLARRAGAPRRRARRGRAARRSTPPPRRARRTSRPAAVDQRAPSTRCVSRIQASITQPVNSHTSSPGRAPRAGPRRSGRRAQPEPAAARAAAAGRRRAASTRRAAAGGGRARRTPAAATAASMRCVVGRARRGCPPSGGRTARRSGTPARSRGTARTSP